ncbi:hypothetical protein GYMLUDRAFT_562289 [Collybiopsis luxurians FD-317 M1]|uniref:Uncharacterized protein n=1 Tax=Collybiopsis luxurians FD-317 M1 TaxID=944289 RepID=A0A0D0CZN7_9AGAR|nr:hypothetical protein GYMLUDRAFT_562289 [Collybiopsis luxurians FD-317 M1]
MNWRHPISNSTSAYLHKQHTNPEIRLDPFWVSRLGDRFYNNPNEGVLAPTSYDCRYISVSNTRLCLFHLEYRSRSEPTTTATSTSRLYCCPKSNIQLRYSLLLFYPCLSGMWTSSPTLMTQSNLLSCSAGARIAFRNALVRELEEITLSAMSKQYRELDSHNVGFSYVRCG